MIFMNLNTRLPIKCWADKIEDAALEQAMNLANLPFAYKHIALMPDAHMGYGMPIGGVMATKNVIVPNAVGVDIGCGMAALKTQYKKDDFLKNDLINVVKEIKTHIPVGFNVHSKPQQNEFLDRIDTKSLLAFNIDRARVSIGTLGSGNHFIELQVDEDNNIWIMLHSGSRKVGFDVANYYNKIAIEKNERWYSRVDKSFNLAFLPDTDPDYHNYKREMNLCVLFAKENRRQMLRHVVNALDKFGGKSHSINAYLDIAHNYVALENHFGENVLVHRKGATKASRGTIGIIPGSQGTCSYIVAGKGNPQSFTSCSHGAGRIMSRNQAKKTFSLEAEIKKMDELGIVHGMQSIDDLDECSSAYKNIDQVMENQSDLVDIMHRLTPIAVIKG